MSDINVTITELGPATGLLLSVEIDIDIADDGTFSDFCVTNTTPTSAANPDPLIDQVLFNLATFDSTQTQLAISNVTYTPAGGLPVAGDWSFFDSSAPPPGGFDHNSGGCGLFQYLVDENPNPPDHRLHSQDTLCFRLSVINPALNPTLRFTEDTFLNAPAAENGDSQVAVSFQRLGPQGADSDCIDGDFEENGEE
ncbi:hypothetical protein [Phosphitispora sp. TUW77]|uniref:hypothetical protein n=1 Tax=Phosphitispora sp. TUW77 TaxID=3152361 RepID=UPI003AB850B6